MESNYRKGSGVFRKSADGLGEEESVIDAKTSNRGAPQSVSPDGKVLLFGLGDLFALPLTGERKPTPYLQTPGAEDDAAFSPDGRWVAYRSEESGRPEIYVQGFPERRGKWLVSSAGGRSSRWRSDGQELYWVGLDDTLMAASVQLQTDGVRVGRTEPLFRLPAPGLVAAFQPSCDGRFLAWEPEGGQPPDRPMVVIQNWAAGLAN